MASRRRGNYVIEQTCIGCGACEYACPGKVDAIYKVDGDFLGRFAITLENCIDCGFCVPMCPIDCIVDAREWPEDERPDVLKRGSWADAGAETDVSGSNLSGRSALAAALNQRRQS